MLNPAWLALLQRIPPKQHDNLMITTSIGTELAVQGILRMEEEYLVIRGRIAGTTDSGRVFFVPYDQINCLGFIKTVKEHEVAAMYGESLPEKQSSVAAETLPATVQTEQTEVAPSQELPPQPVPPVDTEKAVDPAETETPAAPSAKNALLDRLRARRTANAEKVATS